MYDVLYERPLIAKLTSLDGIVKKCTSTIPLPVAIIKCEILCRICPNASLTLPNAQKSFFFAGIIMEKFKADL